MRRKEELQRKVRYLQRILIQMSFVIDDDRPELYRNVLTSLHTAQQLLLDCKKL